MIERNDELTTHKSTKVMLGGNIFGHFTNFEETNEIISAAYDNGFRAIDTADVYSSGLSEEYIGKSVRSRRDDWYVATKVGLGSHADPSGLGRKENIKEKIKLSLDRLGFQYVDLYQLHHYDPDTPFEETLEALLDLLDQGFIREVGLSNFSKDNLREIEKYNLGAVPHQTACNITIADSVVHNDGKLKVVGYSILRRGTLSAKYLEQNLPLGSRAFLSSSIRRDLTGDFLRKLGAAHIKCLPHEVLVEELAIQWALDKSYLRFGIIGIRSLDQLKSVVKAVSMDIPRELIDTVEKIFSSDILGN